MKRCCEDTVVNVEDNDWVIRLGEEPDRLQNVLRAPQGLNSLREQPRPSPATA